MKRRSKYLLKNQDLRPMHTKIDIWGLIHFLECIKLLLMLRFINSEIILKILVLNYCIFINFMLATAYSQYLQAHFINCNKK